MHEVLFDDTFLKDTGVTTLDFAKAMIDEGYPPDDDVLPAGRARRDADRADRIGIEGVARPVHRHAARSRRGGQARRHGALPGAPRLAPRRRLDETKAAREPKLRWKP